MQMPPNDYLFNLVINIELKIILYHLQRRQALWKEETWQNPAKSMNMH